jgi:hypothetical protein
MKTTTQKPVERPSRTRARACAHDAVTPSQGVPNQFYQNAPKQFWDGLGRPNSRGCYTRARARRLSDSVPLKARRYVLRLRDGGEYVERVVTGELETVKLHFDFTHDRARAAEFSYDELWSPYATTAVGMEFTCGFAGGVAERIR